MAPFKLILGFVLILVLLYTALGLAGPYLMGVAIDRFIALKRVDGLTTIALGEDEPGELDRLLEIGPGLLKSGGRMVVISFMSIDDRKVKQKFRALAQEARGVILTKHPLQPSEEEISQNPASRSAKLRALERT